MKRYVFPVMVLLTVFMVGCTKVTIEKTISDFEDAINNNSTSKLEETLSPDSQFYITQSFNELLMHFDGFIPVTFRNLDINVDGDLADVYADASLKGISEESYFVMKREDTFFAFLFPDWRVKEYWDTNNDSGTLEFVWLKIQKMLRME